MDQHLSKLRPRVKRHTSYDSQRTMHRTVFYATLNNLISRLYIGWHWRNFVYTISMPAAVFPPWYGASSAKCLLLWHHLHHQVVTLRDWAIWELQQQQHHFLSI